MNRNSWGKVPTRVWTLGVAMTIAAAMAASHGFRSAGDAGMLNWFRTGISFQVLRILILMLGIGLIDTRWVGKTRLFATPRLRLVAGIIVAFVFLILLSGARHLPGIINS